MRQPGDIYLDPKDGLYCKVIKLGPVLGVEIMHGYEPPAAKPKKSKWPPARETLDLAPVVQKFLLWRFQPAKRPTAGSLTGRQKDRLLRLALVQKRHNWYGDWQNFWRSLRETGATDEYLMLVCHREFGASGPISSHSDKRRVFVNFYRKGKKAVFVIGETDDPDRYVLEGAELLCAVRRAMNVKRIY